jgi:23S rRNA-/tRNA-specific pseudouridylate synthase
VILLTKTKEANPGIARQFQDHTIIKVYQALTECGTRPPSQETWTVKNFLGSEKKTRGKGLRYRSVQSGGDPAQTEFRLIKALSRGIWVEAKPLTGRTHQIRVHLAEAGWPILGDALYGRGPTEFAPRLMLHASLLTFEHPVSKIEKSVQCPVPEDFLKCLSLIK